MRLFAYNVMIYDRSRFAKSRARVDRSGACFPRRGRSASFAPRLYNTQSHTICRATRHAVTPLAKSYGRIINIVSFFQHNRGWSTSIIIITMVIIVITLLLSAATVETARVDRQRRRDHR